MIVCSSISTCAKSIVRLSGRMGNDLRVVVSQGPSCCHCLLPGHSKIHYGRLSLSETSSCSFICFGSGFSKQRVNLQSSTISATGHEREHHEISLACRNVNMKLLMPKQDTQPKTNVGSISWLSRYASAGLISGLLVCYSSSGPVHAEASREGEDKGDESELAYVKFSHGKKVYTDYSITGIPGDGRCLFRSVVHGACLRSGKTAPSENLQRELADDLRASVADEFIKRREETEWFVEGDFDTYVSRMRQPHVWGGEPELFMASHFLCMPITVYMYDKNAGGLISIAQYGQEYGRENPIRVLYHGFGHYDALQIPGKKDGKSRR